MIQIEESAYIKLKEYCKANDKKMGPVVKRLIEEKTFKNILRVRQ